MALDTLTHRYFEAGASIKEVQVQLGHKEIQKTMNIYTHVTDKPHKKQQQQSKNI